MKTVIATVEFVVKVPDDITEHDLENCWSDIPKGSYKLVHYNSKDNFLGNELEYRTVNIEFQEKD